MDANNETAQHNFYEDVLTLLIQYASVYGFGTVFFFINLSFY